MSTLRKYLCLQFFFYTFLFVLADEVPDICQHERCHCVDENDHISGKTLKCNGFANCTQLEYFLDSNWKSLKLYNAKTPRLSELRITNSRLKNLSPKILSSTCTFRVQNFSRNVIFNIENKTFSCSGRNFLEEMDLSNNFLTHVTSWFSTDSGVKVLHLQGNRLEDIQSYSLRYLGRLETLNLSGNNFERIGSNYFFGLTKLKILDISNNHVKIVEIHAFESLHDLEVLNLFNNHIQYLQTGVFPRLHKLTVIDLRHNHLTTLEGADFNIPGHRALLLQGNTLHCDDNLAPLDITSVSTSVDKVLCHSPPEFSGVLLEHFLKFKRVDLSHRNLTICEQCTCSVDRVSLASSADCRTRNLTSIDKVVEMMPDNFNDFYLSKNVWNCSCNAIGSLRNVSDRVKDINELQCGQSNDFEYLLQARDKCNVVLMSGHNGISHTHIVVLIFAVLGILVLVLAIIWKFRFNICWHNQTDEIKSKKTYESKVKINHLYERISVS